MKKQIFSLSVLLMAVMASCNFSKDKSDAYGNFEADEVLVTAEVPGKVISQNMEEGQLLKTGDTICIIDTTDLFLKKEVLIAQKAAIRSKMDNTAAQAAVYRQQKENLLVDKDRFARLLKQKAATQKQYDDIEAGIKVADKQIATALSSNEAISGELNTLDKQLAQVDESIRKCVVTSPVNGTVLEKFLEKGEVASIAKPACKIADMSSLFLRVYIDGTQLSSFKIGGQVDVIVDAGKKLTRSLSGTVTWISASAEFTPKIIQTKEERVDLVYAMKVKVENPDGSLKIAMPGEIRIKK